MPGTSEPWEILAGRSPQNSFCGAHSLAELYSSLTLTAREILRHRRAADAGLSGGIIYDALLLACARKSGAGVIYTFNIKHVSRVAPDLADRMQTP